LTFELKHWFSSKLKNVNFFAQVVKVAESSDHYIFPWMIFDRSIVLDCFILFGFGMECLPTTRQRGLVVSALPVEL
jgi:hypothetical protein